MMTKEERKQIADTILQQLGGGKFIAMTGAKNFAFGETGELTFRIGRNSTQCNCVKVALDPSDTYTMTFIKIRKYEAKEMKAISGLYNDMLQSEFTSFTGLYTSL